jgi:hypothetical protein
MFGAPAALVPALTPQRVLLTGLRDELSPKTLMIRSF